VTTAADIHASLLSPGQRRLVLARLPGRLREARRCFTELTGFTAVVSLSGPAGGADGEPRLLPLLHPCCVALVQSAEHPPCEEHWASHVSASLRSQRTHSHVCPLGLHCTCVPVVLGTDLVGVAKLVVAAGTSSSALAAATGTLVQAVSLACHECCVDVLRTELEDREQSLRVLREASLADPLRGGNRARQTAHPAHRSGLVERALTYLFQHHRDPGLCLSGVAAELGCNGKYLTHLFTRVVGQHMRSYLLDVRVESAARTLLETDRPVKQVAFEAGFSGSDALGRAFRRLVGVSPSEYRRIFAR
jgi:AraC-like DNA-binding protein